MTLDEIRHDFMNATAVPEAALRAAVGQAAALAPEIIALLEKATAGSFLMPGESDLVLFGLHALAAARETSAFPALVAFLRVPEEEIEATLGEDCSGLLIRVLLSLYDGNAELLLEAAEDPYTEALMKWVLFVVLARLAWEGKVARAAVVGLLERFEISETADPDDFARLGWQEAVRLLGVAELGPRVIASWKTQPIALWREVDQVDWIEQMDLAVANPADEERFVSNLAIPLDDPIGDLRRMQWGDEAPDADEPPDPAKDVRLTETELGWLAGFLASGQVPNSTMQLEELDGFFSALVAGPEPVPPAEYMKIIWGTEGEEVRFDGPEQAAFVTGLLTRHCSTIALRLQADQPHIPWIGGDPDHEGALWASGFIEGMEMRALAWEKLLRDRKFAEATETIFALSIPPDGTKYEPLPKEEREQCLDLLPDALLEIHRFWRRRTTDTPVRSTKVGRNDPCPCGSGKKYKKCHGAADATVH